MAADEVESLVAAGVLEESTPDGSAQAEGVR